MAKYSKVLRKLSLIHRRLRELEHDNRTPLLSKVNLFNGSNMIK